MSAHFPRFFLEGGKKTTKKQRRMVARDILAVVLFGVATVVTCSATEFTPEQMGVLMERGAQGEAAAQYGIGLLMSIGFGVPEDTAEAFKWFLLAAHQNHAKAQYMVGLSFLAGRGVDRNVEEGLSYWRKAAENGDQEAAKQLDAYARGELRDLLDYSEPKDELR